ncbi:MAG TPA: phospholipase D-like domain-containing protein [Acidimicrobiales bacterium]|nr:phospholipase D-like domain-containing protein [Acidimicrobiales bacterium]
MSAATAGLVGLVPLAELLADVTGSRAGATRLATAVLAGGVAALPRSHDDAEAACRQFFVEAGIVTAAGVAVAGRAAELVAVCEILGAATVPAPAVPPDPRLVLSAPPGTVPIGYAEQLDGLILDVIRLATASLHIGGAFWNDNGFERLEELLRPAIGARRVRATVYANRPVEGHHRDVLDRRLADLHAAGPLEVRWFCGPPPTMLHAKFVVADRRRGYLGTANLTSWGMAGHVEAGVELTAGQSGRFVAFLDQLEAAGVLSPNRPGPPTSTAHDAAAAPDRSIS